MVKPLEDCLVLDLTRVLAGPYCTMILGDLGARVVKLEVPDIGDDSRSFGPFVNGHSTYFMSVNRNKESMTLNLKSEQGKEIFRKLIQRADVLIENFRPGTLEKLGFSFEELKNINPKIVYTTISGYGHTGPYSHKAAYDIIVQALGGMMSITGDADGEPMKVGASVGDITAGLYAVIGTMGALASVKNGGEGQHVDISMLDTQVSVLENAVARYFVDGEVPKPIGNRHPSISPFCSLPTADGYIVVGVGNDAMWRKCCELIDCKHLLDDNRFVKNGDRTQNWDELKLILEPIFLKKTTKEWNELLDEGGIPCGPIQTIDQVVTDPQITSRNMIVEIEHEEAGKVKLVNSPIKYSHTPCQELKKLPPNLGEHTKTILQELQYEMATIEQFAKDKVI